MEVTTQKHTKIFRKTIDSIHACDAYRNYVCRIVLRSSSVIHIINQFRFVIFCSVQCSIDNWVQYSVDAAKRLRQRVGKQIRVFKIVRRIAIGCRHITQETWAIKSWRITHRVSSCHLCTHFFIRNLKSCQQNRSLYTSHSEIIHSTPNRGRGLNSQCCYCCTKYCAWVLK